ncbi:unnamed protein product, partial [Urochloa humidicola]
KKTQGLNCKIAICFFNLPSKLSHPVFRIQLPGSMHFMMKFIAHASVVLFEGQAQTVSVAAADLGEDGHDMVASRRSSST